MINLPPMTSLILDRVCHLGKVTEVPIKGRSLRDQAKNLSNGDLNSGAQSPPLSQLRQVYTGYRSLRIWTRVFWRTSGRL
jgi:hypothetical protein